jgi:hypothetical protein
MARDWLYPLSSKSGYYFLRKGGRTSDTGPASLEEMLLEGAIDDEWGAYMNWRNVKPNDRIWVYYGKADKSLGVVALAYAVSVKPPRTGQRRATVRLRWDRKKSLKLLKRPFKLSPSDGRISKPQTALWPLSDKVARQLQKYSRLSIKDMPPVSEPRYGEGSESSVTYTPPKTVTARRRHDSLIRPLQTRLKAVGWKPVRVNVKPMQVDLAMRRGNKTHIVEAKTVSGATGPQARAAFAQLCEYSWRLSRASSKTSVQPVLWAIFEKEPNREEIQFLEHYKILVSWTSRSKGRFFHGHATGSHPIVKALG